MSILLLGAAVALHTAMPNYILSEPEWRGHDRSVLLECTPYPYGQARVVNRDMPASPAFLIAGDAVLSRTPANRIWCNEPGPAYYGAPIDSFARAHAWVGEVAISFDPFDRLPTGAPGQIHRARNIWLNEAGLVNQARLVRRAVPRPVIADDEQSARPEPIMTIPRPQKKRTTDLPLEVHRLSPTRIMITDGSYAPDVDIASATK